MMTDPKMVTLTISEETFAIVHRLAGIGMDTLLPDDGTWPDPETVDRILRAMTMFSTWNPMPVEDLDQLAGI